MKLSNKGALLLAAAALATPAPSVAQDVADQANAVAETAQELQQEANTLANVTEDAVLDDRDVRGDDGRADDRDDDDGFPWGLLGLLGLAGLLGLKRNDRDRDRYDPDHARTTTTADRTGSTTDRRL